MILSPRPPPPKKKKGETLQRWSYKLGEITCGARNLALQWCGFGCTSNCREETKGRFRKRVVLANVPSFRFLVPGTSACTLVPVLTPGNIRMYPRSSFWYREHPPKPPFRKPPFCEPPKVVGQHALLGLLKSSFKWVLRRLRGGFWGRVLRRGLLRGFTVLRLWDLDGLIRANRFADSCESLQGSWTEPLFLRIAHRRFEAIRANRSHVMKIAVFLRLSTRANR